MFKHLKRYKQAIIQKLVDSSENQYRKVISDNLRDCASVLDVGCGVNSPLQQIPKTFVVEGIDILPKRKIPTSYYDQYTQGNILHIETIYKSKSFDAVVALEIIEHLGKNEGKRMLKALERITRKKVILSTPNGFVKQEGTRDNPFQEHRSGWTAQDFSAQGYRCFGMRGLKYLRGTFALIKFKPWYVWLFISQCTQLITYFIPSIAFQIIAVKEITLQRNTRKRELTR